METFKELFDPLKDRLNNSIVGSFVISWSIVNWEFWYILIVSKLKEEERINLAYKHLGDCNWIIPTLMMLIYVFALPRIENIVGDINKSAIVKKEKSRLEVDIENSNIKIRHDQVKKQEYFEKEGINSIEELREKLSEKEKSIIDLSKNNKDLELKNIQKTEELDALKIDLNKLDANLSLLEKRYPGLINDFELLKNGKDLAPIEEKAMDNINDNYRMLSDVKRKEIINKLVTGNNLNLTFSDMLKNLSDIDREKMFKISKGQTKITDILQGLTDDDVEKIRTIIKGGKSIGGDI